ncbi:hypothetical protein [Azospirillum doebereinerae]|uniref:Uncharacterized protein n=1 Tax=Azospirillum doebereinerae TaxID=92933 RepID=A0A3S0WQ46_9PROT|nr:hypothetical protein [Azospirillum doebereinerae]RUQ60140.1 hypothetical protein EJ913_30770 [Azospirillum doebereinerae]
MSVTLLFREDGPAFERAKAVADELGLSIEDYLLTCVAEGHKVLRTRCPSTWLDQERPAFIRRGLPLPAHLGIMD